VTLEETRDQRNLESLATLVFAWNPALPSQLPTDLEALRTELRYVRSLQPAELAGFRDLAGKHHVIVRALQMLQSIAVQDGEEEIERWCATALEDEQARIENALGILALLCQTLEFHGCRCLVMKSLDHWPDLGSDLDLYTTAAEEDIQRVMQKEFRAAAMPRSWGDALANKWNFRVPGLPELVEIHVRYLGQTGEHQLLAQRIMLRRTSKEVGKYKFAVPAAEEQILISTLQRMYRHFYFRLCDMADVASLVRRGAVDFAELKRTAEASGIWPGAAAYLRLVANYAAEHGAAIELPQEIRGPGNSQIDVRLENQFLRIPKALGAKLYSLQLLEAGKKLDLRAVCRLPLLPPLAISALVAYRLTGDDKGVW